MLPVNPKTDELFDKNVTIKTKSFKENYNESQNRIAIIGAGWYGCHLAMVLKDLGFQNIIIYDQHANVCTEASGWNQFRLHQGFHYSRSLKTREETLKGFNLMRRKYADLTCEMKENYYAIANNSLLDVGTFSQIMHQSGLKFSVVKPKTKLKNIQGVVSCYEQTFLPHMTAKHFTAELKPFLRLNCKVEKIEEQKSCVIVEGSNFKEHFDMLIDCTYNHLAYNNSVPYFYEPCLILVYRFKERSTIPPSYTIVDGNFISLFEYRDNQDVLFTLTSVSHTPLGKFFTSEEARLCLANLTDEKISEKRKLFEEEACYFIENFLSDYEYVNYFTSCKTKMESASANRECLEQHTKRILSVYGGKITGIFSAEDIMRKWMNNNDRESIFSNKELLKLYFQRKVKDLLIFDQKNNPISCSQYFDTFICCFIPESKNEEDNYMIVRGLIRDLGQIQCSNFVFLTSTLVIQNNQMANESQIECNKEQRNALINPQSLLGNFVSIHFPGSLHVYVPYLYHKMDPVGLSALSNVIHSKNQSIQLFPLEVVWSYIQKALKAKLKRIHLVSAPLDTVKLRQILANTDRQRCVQNSCAFVGVTTQYACLWGSKEPYYFSAVDTEIKLRRVMQLHQFRHLAIADCCCRTEYYEEFLGILRSKGIQKILLTPSHIDQEWRHMDPFVGELLRQKIENEGICVIALDYIFQNNMNIFNISTSVAQESFIYFVESVIVLATRISSPAVRVPIPFKGDLHPVFSIVKHIVDFACLRSVQVYLKLIGDVDNDISEQQYQEFLKFVFNFRSQFAISDIGLDEAMQFGLNIKDVHFVDVKLEEKELNFPSNLDESAIFCLHQQSKSLLPFSESLEQFCDLFVDA